MARCVYCCESAGFWATVCKDCKKLLARVAELRGRVGYGEFLSGLEETGVLPSKIMVFLKADPEGKGSVQDQVTAEMANELLSVMGISERQKPEDVKRIRKSTQRED
ncbi:MAG: hypothetical protein GTO40_29585 [Deltaproteobacteria bacterium]|nr:hypothetical protein [Deltaproteobacteria bacterium]